MSAPRHRSLHRRLREIRAGEPLPSGGARNLSSKGIRARLTDIRRRSSRDPSPSHVGLSIVIEEDIDVANPTPDLFAPDFDASAELPGRERLLVFDLETTGLSAQSQIFMAGYLFWDSSAAGDVTLKLVQEVAADPAEESVLLRHALEHIARRPRLVTYNGRSFDVPHLRKRLKYHSLPPLTDDLEAVDLLHPARRRFKDRLPNCKLGTIEQRIIGKRRDSRDVSGAEAPLRFLDYARHRERRHLEPVLYHNRIDLCTLVALYATLASDEESEKSPEMGEAITSPRR